MLQVEGPGSLKQVADVSDKKDEVVTEEESATTDEKATTGESSTKKADSEKSADAKEGESSTEEAGANTNAKDKQDESATEEAVAQTDAGEKKDDSASEGASSKTDAGIKQDESATEGAVAEGSPARIAPFGKEDTARELQKHAAKTQDTLVDAIENAEIAEIKRSVFRSLTRLRAASIKEFDTLARLESQALDDYNDAHQYRKENPLTYLHKGEASVKEDKYTSFH